MWSAVALFSFPLEIINTIRSARVDRLVAMVSTLVLLLFLVFVLSVKRFMPTYLLPFAALLSGIGLHTPDSLSRNRLFAHVTFALAFSAACLLPKYELSQSLMESTSYGHAISFLADHRARAQPLSEISLTLDDGDRVAHFWIPSNINTLTTSLTSVRSGWYVLSDDSVIKATTTPYGLGDLAGEYLSFVSSFRSRYSPNVAFVEAASFSAEQRFFEIHVGGYWPWRYILALIRREHITQGTNIEIYHFTN
jgi:hypothetical protein